LRPTPNGKVVRLMLARAGHEATAYQLDVRTNLSGRSARTTALRFGSPRKPPLTFYWINVARADLEALRGAGEIALIGEGLDERDALPGFGAVLDSIDKCNADLRAYWNVETPPPPRAAPLKPLAEYFSSDDYPAQSFMKGDSGSSLVMMMIDETGKLRDCMVEETSGVAALDAMTCKVLQDRARFHPATDAAGKPMKSVLTRRITWRMG
jgi:TonB family protein